MPGADLSILQDGERINPAGKPVAYKILLSMPDADYQVIRPHLEFVELPRHVNLHDSNGKLRLAHFPNLGLVSVVVATRQGREIEAGIIGREGVVGIALAAGVARTPFQMMVQIGGAGVQDNRPGPAIRNHPRTGPAHENYAVCGAARIASGADLWFKVCGLSDGR